MEVTKAIPIFISFAIKNPVDRRGAYGIDRTEAEGQKGMGVESRH